MKKTKVQDIISVMENHFPLYLAEDWDNVGLQIGAREKEVKKLAIALDLDDHALQEALAWGADMVITHHPLLFKPVRRIEYNRYIGRLIRTIIIADLAVYSAHTNLDAAEKGINQILAEMIGLNNIEPLFNGQEDKFAKLVVFVPFTHMERVRAAVNAAGAGHIGNYSDCSFRSGGIGAFRPREKARPFRGEKGVLEEVEEYRLETILYEKDVNKVVRAMIAAHPYEEAAYDIYPLLNQGHIYSMGRKGVLPQKMNLETFAAHLKTRLGLEAMKIAGELNKEISRVAVISGAGASLMNKMANNEIDLLITGDVKYHEAQEANSRGIALIDAGHQETEQIIIPHLAQLIKRELDKAGQSIEVLPLASKPVFKFI